MPSPWPLPGRVGGFDGGPVGGRVGGGFVGGELDGGGFDDCGVLIGPLATGLDVLGDGCTAGEVAGGDGLGRGVGAGVGFGAGFGRGLGFGFGVGRARPAEAGRPIGFDASEGDTTTATAPRARAERRAETVGFADRVGVGRVAAGAIVTTFGGAVCGGTERRTSLGPVGSRTVRHM